MLLSSARQRAWGMPDAQCIRSLVCEMWKAYELVTTVAPVHPAFPHAMVLTVCFVLSPAIGVLVTVVCFRKLDASVEASGPHDFAVRVSAVRHKRCRVHRIPSRVRDDREPPLRKERDGEGYRFDLGQT